MSDFLQDVRYGIRQILNSPGFTVAAVVCIALGIGANTATFSFANSMLMYDPPVREPERLVRLFIHWTSGLEFGSWSWPDFADFRARNDVFEGMVAESARPVSLSVEGRNERAWAMVVSGNYFSEMGVDPAMGRGFNPDEYATPGTHPVVVLSHRLWQTRFGSDPDVLGREIIINTHPFTVIGVTQEGFNGTNVGFAPDFWVPFMMTETITPSFNELEARGSHSIQFVTGRLKPGVTIEQAHESLNAFMAQLIEEYPESNTGKTIDVYPESEAGLHPMVRGAFVAFIGVMFLVVGLILLLACANVAGLLLARSAARSREIGIRLSLGASRLRLVRQLLTESTLLALLAGGVGLLLSYWLIRLVATFEPPTDFPMDWRIGLDAQVLLFTFGATVITGVVFGLMPALQSSRQDLVESLKEGSYASSGRASFLRRALVVCQVALSLTLLIGAALAIRSLQSVGDIDLGFEPEGLAVASIDLDLQRYDEARGREFLRALRERLQASPGVSAVGFGQYIPLNLMSSSSGVIPEGYEVPEGSDRPIVERNVVDVGYFEAMEIPILRGRAFAETDDQDAPPGMIVNETFIERFWPGQEPVGKQVRLGSTDYEVIGVAKDGKYFSVGEDPRPYFYRSLHRSYRGDIFIHVRTAGNPTAMLETIRREVEALDSTLPVSDLKTMEDSLGIAYLPARLAANVVTGFAALALVLAAIGLYAVIAYSVNQGVREIGIRMALGAKGGDVLGLVLRQGMVLTAVGLVLGLFAGWGLAQVMSAVLYGISPTDAVAIASASAILAGVAFLASFLPARRATRVDPMVALRID